VAGLIIVRHGRTEANAGRRLLGHLDLPLDDLGRRQAEALGAALGPIDRVITSPLLRTRQTAACLDGPAVVDDRFIELDYGDYDGLALADVPAEMWASWRSDPDYYAPPGGESLSALQARVSDALTDLVDAARTETIVIVAHVSPIKAAVIWTLGVGQEVVWRLFVTPASVTRIGIGDGGRPILLSFNEVAHLDGVTE
jgi:broad specificity phosphatase PhoE